MEANDLHELIAGTFAWLSDHWLGYLDLGLGMTIVLGVPAIISLLYFFLGRRKPIYLRVLKSSHGALLVLA